MLVAYVVTYNDPEYLDVTLESFKSIPDKLYIIEGCWKSSQSWKNESPRSGPETYNIIDKHVDNKRVFLVQANEATDTAQRQIAVDLAKRDGADWLWAVDSDEVYTRSTANSIKAMVERTRNPNVVGYRLRSYNFINSFKKWYDGNYWRVWRMTPGAHMYTHNDCAFDDVPKEQQMVITVPHNVRFHHYSYVKTNIEPYYRKMHYVNEEDPTFNVRMAHKFAVHGDKVKRITIPDDLKIWDFTGAHPAIMRNHPNVVNDVYGDGPLQFLQE